MLCMAFISFQPHLSSLILPRREKTLFIDSALYRQHQCSRLAECVKGNFYFNLLHWAETAEPEHGGHAELHVSAVSGSGKQSKRKTIYSWILSWQFSHYIIATLLHMKPYLLNLQSRSWRTTVRIIVYSGGRLSENCSCGGRAAIFAKILSRDREKVFHRDRGAKQQKLIEF